MCPEILFERLASVKKRRKIPGVRSIKIIREASKSEFAERTEKVQQVAAPVSGVTPSPANVVIEVLLTQTQATNESPLLSADEYGRLGEIIIYARRRGAITYDEIEDMLPVETVPLEELDSLFQKLYKIGVQVILHKTRVTSQRIRAEMGTAVKNGLGKTRDIISVPVDRGFLNAKNDGTVQITRTHEKDWRAIISVKQEGGPAKEQYLLPPGVKITVTNGERVKTGHNLAAWDVRFVPVIAEVRGRVALGDIIENKTFVFETDEATGKRAKHIIEFPSNLRPRITLKDESGHKTLIVPGTRSTLARYLLSVGSRLLVDRGEIVNAGKLLALTPFLGKR